MFISQHFTDSHANYWIDHKFQPGETVAVWFPDCAEKVEEFHEIYFYFTLVCMYICMYVFTVLLSKAYIHVHTYVYNTACGSHDCGQAGFTRC